jgi:hypothetical protein
VQKGCLKAAEMAVLRAETMEVQKAGYSAVTLVVVKAEHWAVQ